MRPETSHPQTQAKTAHITCHVADPETSRQQPPAEHPLTQGLQ
jgi:hypothetical protein